MVHYGRIHVFNLMDSIAYEQCKQSSDTISILSQKYVWVFSERYRPLFFCNLINFLFVVECGDDVTVETLPLARSNQGWCREL